MKLFFRNNALMWLVAGILILQGAAVAQSANENNTPHNLQLNVVFHGLFAYIINHDHIEVLAPQVDEHAYKAGTWGKEFRLKETAVYQLQGIHAEKNAPPLDVRNNLVLKNITTIDRSPAKLFCSFILPLPKQIVGLRMVQSAPQRPIFLGSAAAQLKTTAVPLIQTFIYQIDDVRRLRLNDSGWQPEIINQQVVNLHIWAEPDVEMAELSTTHAVQGFSQLLALFPGVDLQLAFSTGAAPDTKTQVLSLNGWEERTLIERYQLLFPPAPKRKKKGAEIANCIGLVVMNN